MKWAFAYDLHRGSTNEVSLNLNLDDPRLIFGGDIYDLTNTKKSDLENQRAKMKRAKAALGPRYLYGNHEAQRDMDVLWIIPGTRTGVMHGDLIFWGDDKSEAYRRKSHGAGFLKRGIWANALEAFENGYDRKVKTDDLERFYRLAVHWNVDRIIVGHMHPSKHLEIDYKGKRLTVCKRGLTELEIV